MGRNAGRLARGLECCIYYMCVYVCVAGLRELKGGASDPDVVQCCRNTGKVIAVVRESQVKPGAGAVWGLG